MESHGQERDRPLTTSIVFSLLNGFSFGCVICVGYARLLVVCGFSKMRALNSSRRAVITCGGPLVILFQRASTTAMKVTVTNPPFRQKAQNFITQSSSCWSRYCLVVGSGRQFMIFSRKKKENNICLFLYDIVLRKRVERSSREGKRAIIDIERTRWPLVAVTVTRSEFISGVFRLLIFSFFKALVCWGGLL